MPGPQILVVDDEASIRTLLAAALKVQGFEVLLADSGAGAVALYREHAADINLVLMDVRMPGMDGVEAFQALQQINPAVRCCLMSGETGHYTVPKILKMGVLDVLQKPFPSLAEVGQVLRALLKR
jgi:DNA-binding NtrC family response regulator